LLDIEQFAKSYPKQLSGGMAQKVALARALINIPDLLLLDEPFGSLDELTKRSLQEKLQQVLQAEKTTTLMVTHDIEEAIYLADRIIILSKRPGRIIHTFNVNLSKPRNRISSEFINLQVNILKYMSDKLKLF